MEVRAPASKDRMRVSPCWSRNVFMNCCSRSRLCQVEKARTAANNRQARIKPKAGRIVYFLKRPILVSRGKCLGGTGEFLGIMHAPEEISYSWMIHSPSGCRKELPQVFF